MPRGAWRAAVHGPQKVRLTEPLSAAQHTELVSVSPRMWCPTQVLTLLCILLNVSEFPQPLLDQVFHCLTVGAHSYPLGTLTWQVRTISLVHHGIPNI